MWLKKMTHDETDRINWNVRVNLTMRAIGGDARHFGSPKICMFTVLPIGLYPMEKMGVFFALK